MNTWEYIKEETTRYDSNTGKPLVSIYHWVKQDKEPIALVCDAGAKSIARANILAAAPELLEMLEELLAWYHETEPDGIAYVFGKAAAFVDKARGTE